MNLIWTDSRGARRLVLALLLAGGAAGVLGPRLSLALGPAAPSAGLALALAVGGWMTRGARFGLLGRCLLAAGAGLLAGLLGSALPAGLGYALFGLGVGLALTPERLRGRLGTACGRALPSALGALTGGILAGSLAQASAFAALAPATQACATGALLALGVALGELSRHALWVREEPAPWVLAVAERAGAESRPVLAAAMDAHRRVVRALVQGRFDAADRRESLATAEQLLGAVARCVQQADEAARAWLSLGEDAAQLEGHLELHKARAQIRASLEERAQRARTEAGRHAASLTRMALLLVERPGDLPAEPWSPEARAVEAARAEADLERRSELLELRLGQGLGMAG